MLEKAEAPLAASGVTTHRDPVAWAATALATGFGSGYSPVAPGTAGTVVGLLLFWPMKDLPVLYQLAATVLLFALGVPAATHVSRRLARKDPGLVVVDEMIGMWISLLWVPFTLPVVVAAFFAFRAMDILKPPPARGFEALREGWGIVLDDVMAGVYANLIVQAGLLAWRYV
jgi:phosphatidylglycerophosphatase A